MASDAKKEGFISVVRSPFSTTTLKPCPESVNCLERESPEHNSKYSHPCRYSELCRNKQDEPYLMHAQHKVPKCQYDGECPRLADPVHHASYRHMNMADFFIPCHIQSK